MVNKKLEICAARAPHGVGVFPNVHGNLIRLRFKSFALLWLACVSCSTTPVFCRWLALSPCLCFFFLFKKMSPGMVDTVCI